MVDEYTGLEEINDPKIKNIIDTMIGAIKDKANNSIATLSADDT